MTLRNRKERNEAVHGRSFRSYLKNRVWVHPESRASSAKSVRTITFVHATAQQQRVGAQNVSAFIYKRGPTIFFLFLEYCFSRAAWNLFDVGNQLVSTHQASAIHPVRSSALWRGVKTRPHLDHERKWRRPTFALKVFRFFPLRLLFSSPVEFMVACLVAMD